MKIDDRIKKTLKSELGKHAKVVFARLLQFVRKFVTLIFGTKRSPSVARNTCDAATYGPTISS